jgi:hypothetical protein
MQIRYIESKAILQRASRITPQIGKLDIIEIDGKRHEIPYWYQGDRVIRVGDPRPVS